MLNIQQNLTLTPYIPSSSVTKKEGIDFNKFIHSIERANKNAEDSVKESSRSTYDRYIKLFEGYARDKGLYSPVDVKKTHKGREITEKRNIAPYKLNDYEASILCACFLSDMKEDRGWYTSTLIAARAALKYAYEKEGYDPSPTKCAAISRLMTGIDNNNSKTSKESDPLSINDIKAMISKIDVNTKKGIMHRAILALCYCGAFRRSEIAKMITTELRPNEHGYKADIPNTKTGRVEKPVFTGDELPVVEYMNAWLDVANIKDGYIFHRFGRNDTIQPSKNYPHISDHEINRIVQKYAELAELKFKFKVSSHGIRRGAAEDAAKVGSSVEKIAQLLGHSSYESSKIYINDAGLFVNGALEGILKNAR